ncbi:MAG: response regulator [candidate division Zixibacteria bacterium]|nr:response regulator [candidate division Zixibacteria bacterium]
MVYKRAQTAKYSSTKKVLIVDEDALSRDMMSKILSRYLGCEVNMAANDSGALSFLKSGDFDLAILGMSRPDSSIVDLVANIQALKLNLSLIVVSGDGTDADLEILKSMGITKIVYKPLRLSPLLEMVAGVFLNKEQVLNYA